MLVVVSVFLLFSLAALASGDHPYLLFSSATSTKPSSSLDASFATRRSEGTRTQIGAIPAKKQSSRLILGCCSLVVGPSLFIFRSVGGVAHVLDKSGPYDR